MTWLLDHRKKGWEMVLMSRIYTFFSETYAVIDPRDHLTTGSTRTGYELSEPWELKRLASQ